MAPFLIGNTEYQDSLLGVILALLFIHTLKLKHYGLRKFLSSGAADSTDFKYRSGPFHSPGHQ